MMPQELPAKPSRARWPQSRCRPCRNCAGSCLPNFFGLSRQPPGHGAAYGLGPELETTCGRPSAGHRMYLPRPGLRNLVCHGRPGPSAEIRRGSICFAGPSASFCRRQGTHAHAPLPADIAARSLSSQSGGLINCPLNNDFKFISLHRL